jgi:hypothetical protein
MRKWRFLTLHHTGHATPWRTLGGPLADAWRPLGVSSSPCHMVRDGNSADFGDNSANWGGGMALVAIVLPPPHTGYSSLCLFLLT